MDTAPPTPAAIPGWPQLPGLPGKPVWDSGCQRKQKHQQGAGRKAEQGLREGHGATPRADTSPVARAALVAEPQLSATHHSPAHGAAGWKLRQEVEVAGVARAILPGLRLRRAQGRPKGKDGPRAPGSGRATGSYAPTVDGEPGQPHSLPSMPHPTHTSGSPGMQPDRCPTYAMADTRRCSPGAGLSVTVGPDACAGVIPPPKGAPPGGQTPRRNLLPLSTSRPGTVREGHMGAVLAKSRVT